MSGLRLSTHPSALPLAPFAPTAKEPTLLQILPPFLHIIMGINIANTKLFAGFDIPRRLEMVYSAYAEFDYVRCTVCDSDGNGVKGRRVDRAHCD